MIKLLPPSGQFTRQFNLSLKIMSLTVFLRGL
nr:MAG TPA: hypothetical protein [Caudoviricetes sp.]